MIEINLLPEELKVKAKKTSPASGIPAAYIVYFIALFFGTVIIINFCLGGIFIIRNFQLGMLNNKWLSLEPQRKLLEAVKKEYDVISEDARLVQQLMKQRTIWAEKLNKISTNLPGGIWLNEIVLSPKDFILRCSVVSLQKEEMSLISKFINSLKKDPGFFKDFQSLELGSVQIRRVGTYEVVDFVLMSRLASR